MKPIALDYLITDGNFHEGKIEVDRLQADLEKLESRHTTAGHILMTREQNDAHFGGRDNYLGIPIKIL